MIGSPETTALRLRAGYLEAEATEAETRGWDKSTGRSPSLLRLIAAEFRAVAVIADIGNLAEMLADGRVIAHDHFVRGPEATACYSTCHGNPDRQEWKP